MTPIVPTTMAQASSSDKQLPVAAVEDVQFDVMMDKEDNAQNVRIPSPSQAMKAPSKELDRFEVLGDDAVLSIFSFIGHAPLELVASNPGASELTQSLPEVSKFWRTTSAHDCLWKPAILRQLQREPSLWTEGLLKMVHKKQRAWNFVFQDNETPESFLDRVRGALSNASCKKIYRHVVSKHIRQVLPVFYMAGHVLLGGSYRLHMFEPRYRLLVHELLKGYPEEAKKGGLTSSGDRPAPIFIHANRHPFGAASPACLVQLVRCNISPRDGTADVMLLPIAYIWLEKIWIRPNSGSLHYAQCIRMGQKATREMHELINQETLESIITRMGDYLTDDEDDSDDDEEWDDDDDTDDEEFDDDVEFNDIWE